MASPSPDWRTPTVVNAAWHEADEHDGDAPAPPPRPLSGPGTTRQTRRLQLRNAGFKGATLPTRKVTPKSISSSTNWSAVSGIMNGSDAENMSPVNTRASSVKVEKRKSSGILQEIGNSGTLTRPKKARPRVTSGRVFGQDVHSLDYGGTAYDQGPMSPPLPRSGTIKARSVKTRAKMNQKRRSVSGEARMYVDHLEAELASAQTQLSAINSPTVTREQSSKMRTLNTETRQLQEELAEWEAKYEQRVQEEVDRHCEIESTLRSQLRKLEQDAEETKYRLQELESELESATATMEATEAANTNLERRLEIMSDLLATSPTKLDLHAETPSMRRRHQRPKSMLPRFPTASSLVASPERAPRTQPTSPYFNFTHTMNPTAPDSLEHAQLALDTSFSHSDMPSDAGSVFSEGGPPTGGSITSTSELLNGAAHFNPWTLQAAQSAKTRPARRMRRFGAGSACPKPLILPSTSHWQEQVPASAPPLERSETTPNFSFPSAEDVFAEDDDSPSSQAARRRASTTADESTLAKLAASPLLRLPHQSEVGEDSTLGTRYPASAESQMTTRNFSTLGSVTGRNLMDELCAVRTFESLGSFEALSPAAEGIEGSDRQADEFEDRTVLYGNEVEEGIDVHSVLSAEHASEDSRPASLSRSGSTGAGHALSAWDRLRVLFGDLWRSPLAMARHLGQTAQHRMRIPEPLRNVQWWLVGILLGPMARRRMLATPDECCAASDLERQPLLEEYSPPAEAEEALVYGTMYTTPPASPGRSGTFSGKGKKRAVVGSLAGKGRCCQHHQHHRSKHSPWIWLKFSITLAFAVGVAFKDGPASLLRNTVCRCKRKASSASGEDVTSRQTSGQDKLC
ncbi:hypothetical protein LTR85_003450 [Meristemomyces frigidus]|nr:hypothetical protein LTR85_003450 [Meristemomyces frigidus]